MGISARLPEGVTEVDIIVVGGGTTGCVVASRLSDAEPELSILVIEQGQNNYNDPSVVNPALFLSHLLPGGTTTNVVAGNPEVQLDGRSVHVPTAAILGGGSSINMMMYSRAQRSDWNSWETPGWTAEEMLPYLRKVETYHGPSSSDTHGVDGPVQISRGPFHVATSENDFIKAIGEVGWQEIPDLQTLDANNGVQRAMRFVSPDGKRQDAAHVYLHPRLQDGKHPNLHVVVESQVIRVLFDGKRAVGIEYQANSAFQSDTSRKIVKARKLIVISAGAFGSPLLLERSGVGAPEILERAGLPLIQELHGVGASYQDHQLLAYPYRSALSPEETFDALASGRVDAGQLIATNSDIIGWNAQDITCKLRPSDADVAGLGSNFQHVWNRDFKDNANKPLIMIALVSGYPGDPRAVEPGQYFSNTVFSVYPYSRGHVHIKSANPGDPTDFQTGFLLDPVDVTKHVWAYKKQREIARRMDTYRGEVASGHPPFAPESMAAIVATVTPLTHVEDIKYTAEDDVVLKQWLKENVTTTWHSMGTNRMASRESGGVVDKNLGVHGLEALKIADLSIAPANVAANTAATAFAIGEKAADIFIKELALLPKSA